MPTRAPRQGHVIVYGIDGVGFRVIEQLHVSGIEVVVIDDDSHPNLSAVLESWGIAHLSRTARVGDALRRADLEGAIAVVCTETDEIRTLETALQIRELRDDVRLVVQLSNPSVAQALQRVMPSGSVLDVASIAAPSFVEVCLQGTSHEIDLSGTHFRVAEATVHGAGVGGTTLRRTFGHLSPVAILPSEHHPLIACPARDQRVVDGDRVVVVGTLKDLGEVGIDPDRRVAPPRRRVPLARRLGRRLSAAWEEGNRSLLLIVLALVGLVLASTAIVAVGLRPPGHGGHLGLLAATYFTVETVATVGYGDFSFADQGPVMLLAGIGIIILSVILVSVATALFTNILVTGRIERSLGRREVTGMTGHVVVVGLGSVGIAVVRGLVAAGSRVVVVDHDGQNRYLDQARTLGVPVIIADATQPQTHRMVHLRDASAVAVLTREDLTNIDVGLAVRESLGERASMIPIALRIFDQDLARMMGQSFGFQHVRSTSAIAAPRFVGAALGLDVLSSVSIDQVPFLVGRVVVAPVGGLSGMSMADLSARVRVFALRRATGPRLLEHPPRGDTVFAPGDEAFLIGPHEDLVDILQRDQAQPPST